MPELPEGLDERFRTLRRRPKLRTEVCEAVEASVSRVVYGTAYDLWVPSDPLDPEANHRVAPVDEPGEHDLLAGLDAAGRPTLVRPAFDVDGGPSPALVAGPVDASDTWVIHARLLHWRSPTELEVIGFLTHEQISHVSWLWLDEDGRLLRWATAGVEENDLGKGAELGTCTWDGPVCTRVEREICDDRGRWSTEVRTATRAGDRVDAIEERGRTVWARATDAPEETPLPVDEAWEVWTTAIADAAARAVAGVDPDEAVVVHVVASPLEEPSVSVGLRAGVAQVAGMMTPHDAVRRLPGPRFELLPGLGEDALRAMRSLRQHRVSSHQPEVADALQRRLLGMAWPGGAPALLVDLTVASWERPGERPVGQAEYDALVALFPEPEAPLTLDRAPRSREELAGQLVAAGLPGALADTAEWGIALRGRGRGRSRLGGRPELPSGTPWPVSDGRALTHLATIDLTELPDVEGREQLPAEGTLVAFADLTEEGELWDELVVGEDDRVVLLLIPDGALVGPVDPPDDDREEDDPPALLRQRKVRFRPVLGLDLDAALEELEPRLQLVASQFEDALLTVTFPDDTPGHQLLGRPLAAQGDPRADGEICLLHLVDDETLGLQIQDAGDLLFQGAPADVAAGRWDRLTATPSSH